ncbi:MAG: hypothetical protein ABI867_19045, partial [Kofleriaceae bacterium]
ALRWLLRVAKRPEHDVRVIDKLYEIAMARKDYPVAREAAELRWRVARTTTSRLKLAKVQYALGDYDVLLKTTADLASWSGRIDEKGEVWLIVCDVHSARRDWDNALQCLHRLDASGLVATNRTTINKRLAYINEQRTYESKMQAAEALERSVNEKRKPAPKD